MHSNLYNAINGIYLKKLDQSLLNYYFMKAMKKIFYTFFILIFLYSNGINGMISSQNDLVFDSHTRTDTLSKIKKSIDYTFVIEKLINETDEDVTLNFFITKSFKKTIMIKANAQNQTAENFIFQKNNMQCIEIKCQSTKNNVKIETSFNEKGQPGLTIQSMCPGPYMKIGSPFWLSRNGGQINFDLTVKIGEFSGLPIIHFNIKNFFKNKKSRIILEKLYRDKKYPLLLHRLPLELKNELFHYLTITCIFEPINNDGSVSKNNGSIFKRAKKEI